MEYIDYGRILNDAHSYAKRHLLNTEIFDSKYHDRNIKLIRDCIEYHPYFNGKETINSLIKIYYKTSAYKCTLHDVAKNLNITYDHAKKLRKMIIREISSLLELDIDNIDDLISINDTRIFNTLIKNGYVKNSDLYDISYDKLSTINTFGEKSWVKLKEYMDSKDIPYKKDNIGITEIDSLKDLIRNNIDKDSYLKLFILKSIKSTYTRMDNNISFNVYKDTIDPIYNNIVNSVASAIIDIEIIKEYYGISDTMIKKYFSPEIIKRKLLLSELLEDDKSKNKKKKGKKTKK